MKTAAPTSKDRAHDADARGEELLAVVWGHFRRSAAEVERFFEEHDDLVARACLEMARRFHRGGRLLVHGEGAQRSDAEHVAVEFVHPVIVGKRALPAIALGTAGRAVEHGTRPVERELRAIGRPDDIVMVIATARSAETHQGAGAAEGDADAAEPSRLLAAAREMGMLTLELTQEGVPLALDQETSDTRMGEQESADLAFRVSGDDPLIAQEVLETLYHVLWELVHVFLERGDLLGDGGDVAAGGSDPAGGDQ